MRWLRVPLVITALLLAGCGDSSDTASSPKELPKLPGATAEGRAETATAAAASADAKLAIAPAARIRFEPADGLPALREPAAAYRATVKADKAAATRLARALGLHAEPKKIETDEESSWHVVDGQRVLYVSGRGMGEWNLAVPPPGCTLSPDAATVGCPAKTAEPSGRPEPAPLEVPPDLPSPAEAKAAAAKLLRDGGIDFDPKAVRVEDPNPQGITVSFETAVDGVPVVGLTTSITFGSGGTVAYASGTLARFERIGDYPLIGTAEGVRRLQSAYGGAGEVHILGGEEAVAGASAPVQADPGCTPEECGQPEPVEVEPSQPQPQQERVERVDGAELVLQVAYPRCPGGPVYLVPAYRFRLSGGADGPTVNAVDDRYLESSGSADARDPEAAIEPCPGAGRVEPQPAPAVEPDKPVSSPARPAP